MNSYQKRVVRDVRELFVLREANSPLGTIEHRMLCSARHQLAASTVVLDRIFFFPVFLLGGVVLSALAERRAATNLGMCDETTIEPKCLSKVAADRC